MVSCIDEHRDRFGVEPICKVLPIAPSTYYTHQSVQQDPERRSARAKRDNDLTLEIHPFIIDSDYLLSSAAPVRRPGRIGALSGPLRGRTCVPGFLDAAEPFRPHESGRLVLPSAADTASALRMTVFRRSIALPARAATDTSHDTSRCPAHGSRWKRFVTPFLPPDSHRLSTSELA